MYVSNKCIYFHSNFNNSVLFLGKFMFGEDTKIKIPLNDIKSINKKSNAKVFDNSINI